MYSNKNCFGSIWAIQNFGILEMRTAGGRERESERIEEQEGGKRNEPITTALAATVQFQMTE